MIILGLLLIIAILLIVTYLLPVEIGFFFLKEGADDLAEIWVELPGIYTKKIRIPVIELVEEQGSLATRILKFVQNKKPQETVITLAEEEKLSQEFRDLITEIKSRGYLKSSPKSVGKTGQRLKLAALGAEIAPRLHIRIKELVIQSKVGLGDAALTAVGVGFIWTILYNILPLTQKFFRGVSYAVEPQFKIVPVYDRWYLQGKLRCILSFRLGEIIFEGIKSMLKW